MKTFAQERDFSADQRKAAASSGAAMSDGSYPIENVSDLHNAIQAIGRATNPAAVKAHIKTRAKALGATSALPDTWESCRTWVTSVNPIAEAAYDASTGELTVTVIKPGWSKNDRYYSPELLKNSTGIFEGCKMFSDHATDKEAAARPEGRIQDWVASLGKPWAEADGTVMAKAKVIDPPFKLKLESLKTAGLLKQMGVSIRAFGESHPGEVEGKRGNVIERFLGARSVDFVTFAGAGGQVEYLEAAPNDFDVDVVSESKFRERRPDLVELIESAVKEKNMEHKEGMGYCPPMTADEHDGKSDAHQAKADELKAGEKKDAHQQAADDHSDAADAIRKAHKSSALANLHEESAGVVDPKGEQMINTQLAKELKEANEKVALLEKTTKVAEAKVARAAKLTASKLPAPASARLEQHFAESLDNKGLDEAIVAEQEYIKTLGAPIVRNNGAGDNGQPPIQESETKIAELKKRQYDVCIESGYTPEQATAETGHKPVK